ncbi:hypothetical protein AB0M45_31650 [Nocardia sp. NPDC051787]|uniref:hypothetical protein n=1 Tax=Nocardia sp. NPDC051787 TaxID=3155415 RepID=UPI00343CEFB2
MAVGRTFRVLAVAGAILGSALLSGPVDAHAQPSCPSCVADPAPPSHGEGDTWYPLTVPGERSEISAVPMNPAVGSGSAAGSAGLGVALGTGSAGVGVVLGSGSAGLALARGSGSAGLGVALGTGSAALGSAVLGTGSAALGSASPLLLLLIPLPQTPAAPAPGLPLVTIPPMSSPAPPGISPIPGAEPGLAHLAAPAPEPQPAQVPPPLVQPPMSTSDIRPTGSVDALPAPELLLVIGALIALGLAGVGSGVAAVALDHLAPGGVHAGWLSDGVVTAGWIAFAAATSVVASAAWPVVSRRNLRQFATVIYGAGVVAVAVTLVWSFTFGWMVVAAGCVFVVVTGLRSLDWTALGRGIAIYTGATAPATRATWSARRSRRLATPRSRPSTLVAVLAAGQIQRAVRHTPRVPPGNATWAWPAWEVASLLVALGAVWLVVELWVRARVRETRVLHRTLVGRFPEVVAHEPPGISTQLEASDRVAQIMDALYLQSGGGVVLAELASPPASVAERADRVARWTRNPAGEIVVDARWIAPPDGISPRGWVQAIARAYTAVASAPARN